jgi:predicted O-methyltransferase YrrM
MFFKEFAIILSLIWLGAILMILHIIIYYRSQFDRFQHYRQTESLFALYALLNIQYPLPQMRLWAISPDFATLLAGVILRWKPSTIVELGSGISTIICGYALNAQQNSNVFSFEHSEKYAKSTTEYLCTHKLDTIATVYYAPLESIMIANETWLWYDIKQAEQIESIDLLVVDGPPSKVGALARYPALPIFFDKLSDNALIIVDDFTREDETIIVMRWIDEFDLEVVETIANEKGAVILRKRSPRIS